MFHDNDAARAHLEGLRWPHGPVCPHCGSVEGITLMQGKKHRAGLYQCNACRLNFTVTVGTVMEASHIPLAKWVLAFHLMASSKKSMSSAQLSRMLGVTYKSAWFISHRIREAMTSPAPTPIGGEGKVVEADEMYYGKRETPVVSEQRTRPFTKSGKSGGREKRVVVGLVERGGEARATHMVHRVTAENVRAVVVKMADRKSRLHTDESRLYPAMGAEFARHETVNHSAKEYARGGVTTNSVEGFFGIIKRGMTGVYHHCGEQQFQRYLNEFSFRYNTRIRLGYNDADRAAMMIEGANGKRLTYRGTRSS